MDHGIGATFSDRVFKLSFYPNHASDLRPGDTHRIANSEPPFGFMCEPDLKYKD